ncbi:hypothetical protein [Priestia aryabhattai]
MVSVDSVLKAHSKKQKYLGLRMIVIFLLVYFGLEGNYTTENINTVMFLNTIMLLFAPLFLEYLFGMDTYSGYTNTFRWIGLITSIFFIAVCILGLMGKVELIYNNSGLVGKLMIFNVIPIKIFWLKIITYTVPTNAFFDYVFTFNKREIYFYKMTNDLEEFLEQNYEKLKDKGSLESRKNEYKEKYLSTVDIKGGK